MLEGNIVNNLNDLIQKTTAGEAYEVYAHVVSNDDYPPLIVAAPNLFGLSLEELDATTPEAFSSTLRYMADAETEIIDTIGYSSFERIFAMTYLASVIQATPLDVISEALTPKNFTDILNEAIDASEYLMEDFDPTDGCHPEITLHHAVGMRLLELSFNVVARAYVMAQRAC